MRKRSCIQATNVRNELINDRFGLAAVIRLQRSEGWLSADSVEKQCVAGAESGALNGARVPFLSGFSRLLRCGKDLGQFAEVLGGGSEEEFVVCAARPP